MNKIDKKTLYTGFIFLLSGLFFGWLFFSGDGDKETLEADAEEAIHDHEEGDAEVWTCAMHPQIREDGPGLCPICGMELIPVTSGGESTGQDEVQMTEAAMQLADIQTIRVDRSLPSKRIYLPGKVEADERRLTRITSRFPGRIEQLYVDFTGQEVEQGQRLASIYSPELVQAQKELLEAARFRETNPSFYQAAVNKLKLWDINENQIEEILASEELLYNFEIYASRSGTVVERLVSEGDYVKEGQPLLEVSALDELWVLFDAYENDLAWIEEGDEVQFTVKSLPGKIFTSEVVFINPVINPATRVASVRAEVANPERELKPGMFAEGVLESTLEEVGDALVVPKSAVLWTGKRSIVYVKDPKFKQPTFEYREITLGPEAGNFYVITEGISVGEEVVANGVFKVDAAAQLEGKRSMMNPEAAEPPMPPMPGMEMSGGEVQVQTEAFVEDVVDLRTKVPTAFRNQLQTVVETYLVLKEGFVESDEGKMAEASSLLLLQLEEMKAEVLEGEAKSFWAEKRSFTLKHARLGKEAETTEEKRENFSFLSKSLIKVIETFGVNKKLYVNYCPMAEAYWLSEVEVIRNPYMPEMLRCGEIVSVIPE